MQALKLLVDLPDDHQLSVRLPEDLPSGPAEIIVLVPAGKPRECVENNATQANQALLDAIEELRTLRRTVEEEQVLADFEAFREAHPFRLSSLGEP